MWKLIIFVVTGMPTSELHGVEDLLFLQQSECEAAALEIAALAPEPQLSIRTACIKGLFYTLNGD